MVLKQQGDTVELGEFGLGDFIIRRDNQISPPQQGARRFIVEGETPDLDRKSVV